MDENTIKKLVALANSTVAVDGLERLGAAYMKGWDDAEEVVRREMADLLERSGRERAELEKKLRNVEIERDTWKKWCQQAERVVNRLEERREMAEFSPVAVPILCDDIRCDCRLLYHSHREGNLIPPGHYKILHTINFSVHGSGETIIEWDDLQETEERDADS